MNRILSIPVLAATLSFLLILNILCIGRYPAIGGNEVYYGSTAHTLVTKGVFARVIHQGGHGYHVRDYFPPTITLLIAFSYLCFGFGVWQTKILLLFLCVLAAFVMYPLARRVTRNARSAILAVFLFILNADTFTTWQGGRFESIFLFIAVLILYFSFLSCNKNYVQLCWIWFLIGILTALEGLTYYPFAVTGVIISILFMWNFVWERLDLQARQKIKVSTWFFSGISVILFFFALHVLVNPCLFRLQILTQTSLYFNAKNGLSDMLQVVMSEYTRYLEYGLKRLGVADIILGILAIIGLVVVARKKPRLKILWISMVIWVLFLFFYGPKFPLHLSVVMPYFALGSAVVYDEIISGNFKNRAGAIFRSFVYLTLIMGMVRIILVGYTLAYQWQGRDYASYDAYLKKVVPDGASVIGPQTVWYALVNNTSSLRIYSPAPTDDSKDLGYSRLNDPKFLADVTHIIIMDTIVRQPGVFLGLRSYVDTHFKLSAKIRMPFKPLPWARQSPLDVDVYERIR